MTADTLTRSSLRVLADIRRTADLMRNDLVLVDVRNQRSCRFGAGGEVHTATLRTLHALRAAGMVRITMYDDGRTATVRLTNEGLSRTSTVQWGPAGTRGGVA